MELTSDQARIDLAVGMYSGRRASMGRAAKIAGMPKVLFILDSAVEIQVGAG